MKPPAAGKGDNLTCDGRPVLHNKRSCFFEVRRVQHNKWRCIYLYRCSGEASAQSPILETRVVRALVRELPAETLRIEFLRGVDIESMKLDVIDPVMVLLISHTSLPTPLLVSWIAPGLFSS